MPGETTGREAPSRPFEFIMGRSITSVKIGRRRLVVRSSLDEFVQHLVETQDVSEKNRDLECGSDHWPFPQIPDTLIMRLGADAERIVVPTRSATCY